MEETLKAARLLHHIVIAVAATLLAFALSTPEPQNEYTRALDELAALTAAMEDLPSIRTRELDEFYQKQGVQQLVASHLRMDRSRRIAVVPPETSIFAGRATPERTKLLTLYSEIETVAHDELAYGWFFESDAVQEALRLVPKDSQYWPLLQFDVGRNGGVDLLVAPIGSSRRAVRVPIRHKDEATIPLRAAREMLEQRNLLVTPADGRSEALPALRAVWDTVEDVEAGAARRVLQRRAAEVQRAGRAELELLGLKLRASVAIIGGPLLVLLSLIYFLTHIIHLRAIATPSELLSSFPWVALFRNPLAITATWASVLVLPATAVACVIVASGLTTSRMALYSAATLLVIEIVAFAIVGQLTHLRRQAGPSATA